MQRTIKLETHYLEPPYKIREDILSYGDQQDRSTNVKADHTHYSFDRAFVWFVDTSDTCSPLIFPDPEHPWLPPIHVIKPKKGMLVVFGGMELHYVPPQINGYTRIVMSGNMANLPNNKPIVDELLNKSVNQN